jgi:hypothetical protein
MIPIAFIEAAAATRGAVLGALVDPKAAGAKRVVKK